MDCEEIRANLLAYLDGEVGEAERAQIEAHLAECEGCAAELARLQALQADLLDAIPAGLESLRLPDAASARIRGRLDRARGRQARGARGGLLAGWAALLRPGPALVKVAIPLLTLIVVVVAGLVGRQPAPVRAQETIVVVPETLAPDTDAALRVIVREEGTHAPVADAELEVQLRPRGGSAVRLYSGRTGGEGSAEVRFRVPGSEVDHLAADLVVTARSPLGEDRVVRAVEIRRSYRLYLGSDKPLYRPGQTVHLRVLALDAGQGVPAEGRAVQFEVQDPGGRTVHAQQADTSAFGIAAADAALGTDAPPGEYRLSVTLGDTVSEQTVTVGRYERPPFRVELAVDRPYYVPGETVEGEAAASRLDGAAITGAEATVRAYVHDPERVLVATLQGRTDGEGKYRFRFSLPSALGAAQGSLSLEAEVRDETGRAWSGRVVPVAAEALAVDVVAEGGRLRPGVENQVYVLVSTPDGAPVQAELAIQVDGQPFSLATDAYGLAMWGMTPEPGVREVEVELAASDALGRSVTRATTLSADRGLEQVLLRLDRASYRVGESMHLEVLAGEDEPVYVDVVEREHGQTLSTQVAHPEAGRATLAVDLSPQMAGTLEVHAYQVLPDGTLARDARLAVVRPAAGVDVALRADRASYGPGEVAQVALSTSVGGRPVLSALGIAVVDESVYALAERAPGFAKLFFTLEQGLEGGALVSRDVPEEAREAQDRAARASWVGLPARDLALAYGEPGRAAGAAEARRAGRLRGLAWGLGSALVLLCAGLWLTVVARLRTFRTRRATVWRVALAVFGLTLVILIPGTVLLTLGVSAMLGAMGSKVLLGLLLAAWAADLIVLGVSCKRQEDDLGQIVVLLVAAYGVLGVVLGIVVQQGGDLDAWTLWAAAISFAGTWIALLAWAVGLWLRRRRTLSAAMVVLVLLSVALVVLAGVLVGSAFPLAGGGLDPRVYLGPAGWLSGCAPAPKEVTIEVEKEVVVKETVEVEKVVEVTRLVEKVVEVTKEVVVTYVVEKEVEVEKEVTKLAAETRAPQATPTPASTRPAAEPTATPAPGVAPTHPTATPPQAQEPARPTAPLAPAAAPPLPLLGQVAPETIYWAPEALTDAQGRMELELVLAGVPATWRMTVLASTLNGELGEGATLLVVK